VKRPGRGPGATTHRPASRAWRLTLALAVASSLSACIYVPRTIAVYDADCRVHSRQMVLQPVQLAAIQSCSNSACASLLVAAGATAAASAVISGSIVIVGNMVYWFEKQGSCRGPGPAAPGRQRAD
jgi:hypothetical protein